VEALAGFLRREPKDVGDHIVVAAESISKDDSEAGARWQSRVERGALARHWKRLALGFDLFRRVEVGSVHPDGTCSGRREVAEALARVGKEG
jgi:hypothetical protein